jgi:hypothetical protein
MSEHKFEQFSYTPIELAESMTNTVHETLKYLLSKDYITEQEFLHLYGTLAVYAMPNRKGFGQRLRERFFGRDENEHAFVFPIIEVDARYKNTEPKTKGKKPNLNVVSLKKDKQDE